MDLILQLRRFVVIAEEMSFGRAARRIGVAQPPLSQGIRRLEAHLGAELIDRSRRQIALTDAGSILLVEARSLLTTIDQLPARICATPATGRSPTLGVPPACPAQALLAVAGEVEGIRVVALGFAERSERLSSGELDVALVHASARAGPEECFEQELGFAGAPGALHPVDVAVPVLMDPDDGGVPGTQSPVDHLRLRGLAPHLITEPHDSLSASIQARLGRAYWLTTKEQADRFELSWHALVGRPLFQRFEIHWHSPADAVRWGDQLHTTLRSAWPQRTALPLERGARDWGLYPR